MEILKNPNFDFLGKTRIFVGISLAIILASLVYMLTQGVYLGKNAKGYGVEFSGGTQLIIRFQNPPEVDRIRSAVSAAAPGATIQTYGEASGNQVLVRLASTEEALPTPPPTPNTAPATPSTAPATPSTAPATQTSVPAAAIEAPAIDAPATRTLAALAANYGENAVVESSSEIVGPVVGAELRRRAVQLTVLGLFFQLIYITIRFKGAVWGAAATIAVLHDVLVTLGFLALFRYEITLNVIAALLTLVGYSVNDTIVIFDRARENLRHKRKDSMRKILNDSLNQTLTRTIISNGTTFLAVLGLFLFGGEVLRGFGFTMVVGILAGTYSTIYIASPIVAWWDDYSARRKAPAMRAA